MAESHQLLSALVCVEKGWYVFPLGHKSKIPDSEFAPNGFRSSTNDIQQVKEWWTKKPNANIGIDLGRSNLTVLDFDKGRPPEELNLPETLQINTSRGTHVYFTGTSQQGNMFFNHIHIGEVKSTNGYVLAPFSEHPDGPIYSVALKAPIAPLPLDILERLKPSRKIAAEEQRDEHNLVPHGMIHNYLLTQAGRLRNLGLDADAIEVALLELAHKNCAPPLDDSKIKTMAKSICNFPAGRPNDILFTQPTNFQVVSEPEEPEPSFNDEPYPKFPKYTMQGTSIYEGFVKPICAVNSRIDYFMFLPALQILLNYVGPKIKIKGPFGLRPFRGSIYSVLIGRKGKTNKSSSVDDAMKYFNYAGLLQHVNRDTRNAEGKTLVWTAGSPEGLGLEAQKANCKNMFLYYDELQQLVSKAGIDASAMISGLLTMYESGKFQNSVKSSKESFSLDPDTYCTSLVACTTDKKFTELWSKLAGSDTGLNDRFTFVYQPEILPVPSLQQYVNTVLGAAETRRRIDLATNRGEIEFEDQNHPAMQELVAIENRYANRAEKWAVALAVDLGLDAVDGECCERAADIVKYEIAVKKYLQSYEATTREGQIQQETRRALELAKGSLPKRELLRKLNYDRHGTSLWGQAYNGLIRAGIIKEEGAGTRDNPVIVKLLKKREIDDD